jgi:hypothetical protein
MSIQGFIVKLSTFSYETPGCCASCLGPAQKRVKARGAESWGRGTRILTMTFPYCDPCAKRAGWAKIRAAIVWVLAGGVGFGLAYAAWHVHAAIGAPVRFAVALPLGMAFAALLALVTRPSLPAPPATARGEAVILKDASGTVLCTNPRFAELLAQANGVKATAGAHRRTLEVEAPLGALLFGLLVVFFWFKSGAPAATAAPTTSAPVAASTVPG